MEVNNMKKLLSVAVAFLILLSGIKAYSASEGDAKEAASVKNSSLVYTPRPGTIGRPIMRVSGGTRGAENKKGTILEALAPDHTGLTLKPQPTLCWFQSSAAKTKMEITINDEKATTPVFEQALNSAGKEGILCLNLADYKVSLAPGMEYQWFVALVPDPEQRAVDLVGSGLISVVTPSGEIAKRLANTPKGLETVALYASEGLWYDTIASLTALIEANPGDKKLKEQRAYILEKAGLSEAARFDRK